MPSFDASAYDRFVQEAVAARRAGDHPLSADLAQSAIAIDRGRADAWLVLCAALTTMGSVDLERALGDALKALANDHPARPMLTIDRAKALAGAGRAAEAAHLARSVDPAALNPRQRDTLASVLASIALYDEALPNALAAVAATPQNPIALYNLGTIQRYLGRTAEAEATYERAIALDPDMSRVYASLAELRRFTSEHNHVAEIDAAIARTSDPESAARLHHARFRELDGMGRTDEAWQSLVRGSALAKSVYGHDGRDAAARTDALIKFYTASRFSALDEAAGAPAAQRPIFVFGLPRSGTTLTERILAAHSRVTPLGETSGMALAIKAATGAPLRSKLDAETIRAASAIDHRRIAAHYLDEVRYLASDAPVFTEKLPHNYEVAGLLALAFPEGSFVHVRRAPMDSLFGAHKILFGEGGYHWSYDFNDLLAHYRLYRRLMTHWRACLGGRMIEITLETLIDHQEREIRRLLDCCRLEFEAACLSPHETEGGVSTASSTQVRAPINRQGVGAWRKYARELEPLRAALEADGFVDADGEPIWD